jgi:hypothetical protein
MDKQLIALAIYVTLCCGWLHWRMETLPGRLEQTLQTVSNQMAVDSECVDEDDFFVEDLKEPQ